MINVVQPDSSCQLEGKVMSRSHGEGMLSDSIMVVAVPALGLVLFVLGVAHSRSVRISSVPGQRFPEQQLSLFSFEEGLAIVCSLGGLVAVLWWVFALVIAVLAVLTERHGYPRLAAWSRRLSPAFLRRLAAAMLGINLLATPAAFAQVSTDSIDPLWKGEGTSQVIEHQPATASPFTTGPVQAQPAPPTSKSIDPKVASSPEPAISPLWTPPPTAQEPGLLAKVPPRPPSTNQSKPSQKQTTQPSASKSASTTELDAPDGIESGSVVVLRGDSLWSIAAKQLGPRATTADIAAAWPKWYERNRLVIGPDPDVVLPGQILARPRSQ